jgi:hypothetical protein
LSLLAGLSLLPGLALLTVQTGFMFGWLRTAAPLIEMRWLLDRIWLGFLCAMYFAGGVVLQDCTGDCAAAAPTKSRHVSAARDLLFILHCSVKVPDAAIHRRAGVLQLAGRDRRARSCPNALDPYTSIA